MQTAPVAVLGTEDCMLLFAERADATYGFMLRRCSIGVLAADLIAAAALSMDTMPA